MLHIAFTIFSVLLLLRFPMAILFTAAYVGLVFLLQSFGLDFLSMAIPMCILVVLASSTRFIRFLTSWRW